MASKNIYIRMWQDALCNIKIHNPQDYKWMSIVLITMCNALHIMALLILLNALFHIKISIFEDVKFSAISQIDSLLKFFLLFYLAPLVMNYLIIFRNQKYNVLLQKYENRYKGKLFAAYGLISIAAFICSIIVAEIRF